MFAIETEASKKSQGHYVPALVHGGIAYISGQLPVDYTKQGAVPTGTLEEQTRLALHNLENVLTLCHSAKNLVLKTTVYIPDIKYWVKVNEIYKEFFGTHKPARTIVPTNELHFGALLEIEAIAAVQDTEKGCVRND